MQIGEVAARVGLSMRTIRHWGELGLVVPSGRSQGGFRLYTEADVERLLLIKTLRPLDFTLEQIRELLEGVDALAADDGTDPDRTAALRGRIDLYRTAAESRLETLRTQMMILERLSRELRALTAAPHRSGARPR